MAEFTSHAYAIDYSGDSTAGIFEPDVILPSEFLPSEQGNLEGGERKLMAALLSDGIESYIAQATDLSAERGDACEWVETKDHGYVFSFDVVCECLGINADYLRMGLTRYVEVINAQRAAALALGEQTGTSKRVWKKIRRPRK